MKKFLVFTISIAFIVAAFSCLCPTHQDGKATGLPWQINLPGDGSSQVFGITLGATSFNESAQILGAERETAVLIDQNDNPSLEMYYSHFQPVHWPANWWWRQNHNRRYCYNWLNRRCHRSIWAQAPANSTWIR